MAEDNEGMEATLNESVGERVKRIRESRGMSPADLAARVRVGEAAIKKLESGGSKAPSLQNAVLIADALGVDIWTLAFGEERPRTPASEDTDDIAKLFEELLRADMDRNVKRLLVLLWSMTRKHRDALREIQGSLQLERLLPLDNDQNEPEPPLFE